MPRPKSKAELKKAAADNFESLTELIDTIPSDRYAESGVCDTWSINDIIAHLHEWHNMMIIWHDEGMAGKEPAIPAPGYTWKTTPDLNQKIYAQYKDVKFNDILKKLHTTHKKMMRLIEKYSDNELFTKKKYSWTGSTSLGAYLISATSSHYDWAEKLIKKWAKNNL